MPPGTCTSLYENPEYAKAPFANRTLESINSAVPTHPTVDPVPYVGVKFVAIPEFQGVATAAGQQFSAALAGSTSIDNALANAQALTEREMTRAGYIEQGPPGPLPEPPLSVAVPPSAPFCNPVRSLKPRGWMAPICATRSSMC